MKLGEVIKNLNIVKARASYETEISDIAYDSRKVKLGNIFVCLNGAECDGHDFIKEAIKNGANTIIIEKEINVSGVNTILVENTRVALALISKNFFKSPSSKLKIIGITGTKGKTTTACMIKSILELSEKKTGMIGTLGAFIGKENIITLKNTTPESYDIQKYLRNMVDNGCEFAILEVSSIALRDHRVDGLNFDFGIFTNLSEDHIGGNEHKNIEEYILCKSKLFRQCKVGFVNIDDKNAGIICNNNICDEIKTFGFSNKADVSGIDAKLLNKNGHLGCEFKTSGDIKVEFEIPIPGKFNVYNALAAVSVCNYLGIKSEDIKNGLAQVKIKGRMEPVKVPGEYSLFIDYAHNAASMENILKTLREYKPKRIITMFGGGGNRPKIRRYEMGEISGRLSDISVITADNSRNEDVMDIISDIKEGLNKTNGEYIVIPDRKEAIKYCIKNAQKGDIVVLAGKGHETYQEIKGVKYPFDERVVINDILK